MIAQLRRRRRGPEAIQQSSNQRKNMPAEIRLTKTGPHGGPYAEILVSPKATLDELIGAQKTLYTDGLKALGLRACPSCRSGLDFNIRQQFEKVIQVG
jgi:hypothetical protein